MTTELILKENQNYDASVLAALGFGRAGGGAEDTLPRLSINFDHVIEVEKEDGSKEDVSVVAGCFKVSKDGETVYSMKNPVTLRIFMQRFLYAHYDEQANDGKGGFVAQSILANNGEEPIDDKGGIACGKLRGKAAKGELSDTQKKLQKAVNSFRVIFGTVSFKGQMVDGKKVEVTDYPIQMRLRGKNYMPVGDILKEFEKRKVIPMSVGLTLKTKREKNGATTYYIIEYDYDLNKRIPIGKAEIELVNQFTDHVRTFNASIREKHMEALKSKSAPSVVDDSGLDDDFGEEPDDSGTEIE